MTWNGSTCAGTAATYIHEAALAHATSQAGSTGWRLPNIKELSSIADRSRANFVIDTTAFPATADVFWSASPDVGSPDAAWGVNFRYGFVGSVPRANAIYTQSVRLVRASQ